MAWQTFTAVVGFVLIALAWTGVQLAWRRTFARVGDDPDALAVRATPGSCCFCTKPVCDREAAAEETRS